MFPRPVRLAAAALLAVGASLGPATSPALATGSTGFTSSTGPNGLPSSYRERDRDYRQVGYFVQWGIYGRAFFPKNVETTGQASRLTTIDYAFENVGADGLCFEKNQAGAGDAFADYQRSYDAATSVDGVADTWAQPLKGNFNQLRKLKARHPNLSVLVSIGGFTYSKYFSDAALTAASRRAFVASCIDEFIKGNLPQGLDGDPAGGPGAAAGVFDGIDVDWEWPGSAGNPGNIVRPQDKRNFALLLAEFRRQLDAYGRQTGRHYALSAFLPADPAKIAAGIAVRSVLRPLDWASVQGYDLHGPWEPGTNHQAQLYSPAADPAPQRFSADLAIRTYLRADAPARKLLLGIPYYGHGWTNVADVNHGLYQAGTPAPGTFAAGTEDYKVLAALAGPRFHDARIAATWFYDGSTFWSYDDPWAVTQKTRYVRRGELGGTMVWELDGDDGTLTAAIASGLRGD